MLSTYFLLLCIVTDNLKYSPVYGATLAIYGSDKPIYGNVMLCKLTRFVANTDSLLKTIRPCP